MEKEKYSTGEKIIVLIFTIVFISPAFIVQEGPRLLYGIFAGSIGFSISKEIIFYSRKKGKKEKRKKANLLLSNFAIFIYIIIYVLLSTLIDFRFLQENFLLYFGKIIFSTYLIFYSGLKGLKTGKMGFRGGQMYKKSSYLTAFLFIILALFSLMFTIIFK
jgi:hypothetical protein